MKKDINTVYPTQLYKYKWRSQTLDLLVVKETCQHLRGGTLKSRVISWSDGWLKNIGSRAKISEILGSDLQKMGHLTGMEELDGRNLKCWQVSLTTSKSRVWERHLYLYNCVGYTVFMSFFWCKKWLNN
jgi:hypothetical protein